MDPSAKTSILHDIIKRMGGGGPEITTPEWLNFVEAQNDGYRTGPAVGAKVPDFALPDQNGRTRTLADLTGPRGLLLIFSRSAGW